MVHRARGFTLVELAIVLVIIALLLGGILKGQELVTSAKIRNLAGDFTAVAAATYAYQERFQALPGDDSGASGRWGYGIPDGDRGGSIGGEFCADPSSAGESVNFWRHLRLAGLLAGDAGSADQPANAASGIVGVQTGTGVAKAPDLPGLVICSSNLSGKIASALDAQFDDGKPQTGTVRAYNQARAPLLRGCTVAANVTRAAAVPNATGYNAADDAELYTLCKAL